MRGGTRSLDVLELSDFDRGRYDQLVSADPKASPFHAYEWLRCLEIGYPSWQVGAAVEYKGRELVAALPFVRRRRRGVVLWESLPFGLYGGPIAVDPSADTSELVERFMSGTVSRGSPFWLVRLIDFTGERSRGHRREDWSAAVVDLRPSYAAVRGGYHRNVRKNIRRAESSSLEIRRVATGVDAQAFFDLAAYAYDLHSSALRHSLATYEAVARIAVPAGRARFELALLDGLPIAGSLHAIGGPQTMNWLTVARREFQGLRANTLLIDRAIRAAVELGLGTYNLGASPDGSEGLLRFKQSWGASDYHYHAVSASSALVGAALRTRDALRNFGGTLAR